MSLYTGSTGMLILLLNDSNPEGSDDPRDEIQVVESMSPYTNYVDFTLE